MKYLVEPQTGELAEEVQEDMFDPLTPDMEQDDAVDKLYGNLSDGEIQVRYHVLVFYIFLHIFFINLKHWIIHFVSTD